jgi:hypothetical protein
MASDAPKDDSPPEAAGEGVPKAIVVVPAEATPVEAVPVEAAPAEPAAAEAPTSEGILATAAEPASSSPPPAAPAAPAAPVDKKKEWALAIVMMIVFALMAFRFVVYLRNAGN